MTKSEIRLFIKSQKAKITQEQMIIDANKVASIIEASYWFKNASHILTYHSLPDEICTLRHFDWHKSKSLYLPRVNGNTLEILPYGITNKGAFNIQEPIGNNIIHPKSIELIIVPGVAFDYTGTRVGRGKGYYDKLLSNTNALKIGICYDFQLIKHAPRELHDIAMDAIITPNHQIILNKTLPWI